MKISSKTELLKEIAYNMIFALAGKERYKIISHIHGDTCDYNTYNLSFISESKSDWPDLSNENDEPIEDKELRLAENFLEIYHDAEWLFQVNPELFIILNEEERLFCSKNSNAKSLLKEKNFSEFKKAFDLWKNPKIISKTQISHLINGVSNIKRDLTHPKYQNAKILKGNYTHSDYEERAKIAKKVMEENQHEMQVKICGVPLVLKKESHRTKEWFSCVLTKEEEKAILFKKFHYESKACIVIDDLMFVQILHYSRKDSSMDWKERCDNYIAEEFVEII